jgi:hypothetical protein
MMEQREASRVLAGRVERLVERVRYGDADVAAMVDEALELALAYQRAALGAAARAEGLATTVRALRGWLLRAAVDAGNGAPRGVEDLARAARAPADALREDTARRAAG